jgi:hypothetical protein
VMLAEIVAPRATIVDMLIRYTAIGP